MVESATYRLPRTVTPKHYELTLSPDLEAANFAGEESITVDISEPIDQIQLNAIELEVHDAELISDAGDVLPGSISYDEPQERLMVSFASFAAGGEWTLKLTFSGILNDKLHGFYRSVARDSDGTESVIATTQFEATDARRAFPCWDEPDFKATFQVTLIVDEGLAAFSNSSVDSEEALANGKRQVVFAPTMKMSTYLVAFIVGPLVVTDPVDVDGVPLRVSSIPGREHLAPYALEVGAFALRFFTKYFEIPYPGDKLDLVALPDFAFGAMENLGCVTFRETALLVDRDNASRLELERVADVVAHEIAHMWFGDLVTMKWWNGIWLNEAFATFMELQCVDAFRAEWQRWTTFAVSRAAAFNIDGLQATRPVEFPVVKPEEADGMFDTLTYQKGGAVLRMFEQYMGPEFFRTGIARYLKKHGYSNAETTDLWDALEATSGDPIRSMADSWIFQGGYPLVSGSLSDNGTTLELRQHRFTYSNIVDETRWQVPVLVRSYNCGATTEHKVLIERETATLSFDSRPDCVVINSGGSGFYRVNYSEQLLGLLRPRIQQDLTPLERFTLISDTWAATIAGHVAPGQFLDLVGLFDTETDPDVWLALLSPLSMLDRMLSDDDRVGLQEKVRKLARPVFDRLGWQPDEGETERTATLRGVLVSALGNLGADAQIVAEARNRHTAHLRGDQQMSPDLATPIVGVIAANGDSDDFDMLTACIAKAETPQEEVRYLFALGRFSDSDLLTKAVGFALSEEVRAQDAPYLLQILLTNRLGGELVWKALTQRWSEIMERFPENSIARMIEGLSAQSSPSIARNARTFLTQNPVPQGAMLIAQTLESLDVNAAFREAHASEAAAALRTE